MIHLSLLANRHRNRLAAGTALALLLVALLGLATQVGVSAHDISLLEVTVLDGDASPEETSDGGHPSPWLLPVTVTHAKLCHRTVSIRQRDAIIARAQSPPGIVSDFT